MSKKEECSAVTFAIAEDEPLESEGMEAFILRSFPQASVLWRGGDGESALDAVHAQTPDVLIVDIEMPVLNGLQLCEILYRENYNGVILINTAYSKFSYAKKAISLKVFDYILKPMDNDELYTVLSACIAEATRRKTERSQKDRHKKMALEVSQYAFSL
ncbi:MAG: response regulator, partial [Lachnospiraceae bacterium]|nr:response regulator [Lachnospiraceae bacterium]